MIKYATRFISSYYNRHLKRVWSYKFRKKSSDFPSVIQIQTINDCNGSCSMCPNSQIKNKNIESISNDLFQKIISEIINESKSTPLVLLYLQNEPLMDENIFKKIQIINNISSRRIHIGFLTNGSLLSDEKIKKLEEHKELFVSVSIDALSKVTYDKIRGNLNFDEVQNNLKKLLNSNFNKNNIAIEFTVQKNNIHEYKNFKKFWRKKTGGLLVNYLTNRSGDLDNYEELYSPKNNYQLTERIKINIMKRMLGFCPLPFTSFNILSNGDVIVCREDWTKKIVLGNVKKSSIKDIWNNEKYNEIRQKISNKKYNEIDLCKNCSRWKNGYFQIF